MCLHIVQQGQFSVYLALLMKMSAWNVFFCLFLSLWLGLVMFLS